MAKLRQNRKLKIEKTPKRSDFSVVRICGENENENSPVSHIHQVFIL
jgi:hypothetical protein